MSEENVWYQQGLPFKCTECGQCCTGSPGYVWVNSAEIAQISSYLGISEEEFVRKYTRRVGHYLALLEHPKNYDCVFLQGKHCTIYPVRPKQCKTFPWWPEHLTSPEAWQEAAHRCEGISQQDTEIVPLEEIQKHLS